MGILNYVLITAARNEEAYIENTILSVLGQSILPLQWVIVSDGSTDETDAISRRYAESNNFIKFVRKETSQGQKGFESKVAAIHLGYEELKGIDYDFVGNLDADVSFKPDYFEKLLKKFADNPRLGIGGGYIHENLGGRFRARPSNSERSVAGGIQLFRRQCYETIGGLQPTALGGEDWRAEIMARMTGWMVQAFPELQVYHHKRSVAVRGILRDNFRQGLMDYSFGSLAIFELSKCLRRVIEPPFCIGALARLFGYLWGCTFKKNKVLSEAQIDFLRTEQSRRILRTFKNPI